MAKSYKSPAFKLYVESFVMGTLEMTSEQIGGYILLLCYQWDKGFIPKDKSQIKAVAKISEENVEIILRKFSEFEGGFRNERLEIEREKQKRFSKTQSSKGLQGGRPKSQTKAKVKPNESQTKAGDKPSISISSITTNVVIYTHPLIEFSKSLKRVSKMEDQLTEKEAISLINKFGDQETRKTLLNMDNYKPLIKKNTSVYRTCGNWITRDRENKISITNNGQGMNLTGQTANP